MMKVEKLELNLLFFFFTSIVKNPKNLKLGNLIQYMFFLSVFSTIKLTFLSSNVLLLLFCFSFTGGGGGLIQDWTSFGPRLKRSSSDLELRGKVLCSSVKTRRGRRSGFEEEAEEDDKFMICEH